MACSTTFVVKKLPRKTEGRTFHDQSPILSAFVLSLEPQQRHLSFCIRICYIRSYKADFRSNNFWRTANFVILVNLKTREMDAEYLQVFGNSVYVLRLFDTFS